MEQKADIAGHIKSLLKKNWHEVFVVDGFNGRTLRYSDFFHCILNGRDQLEKSGLKEKDAVIFFEPNSLELVILYFSSLLLGLVIVPVDKNRGENEIKDIISLINYKKTICSGPKNPLFDNYLDLTEIKKALYEKRNESIKSLDIFNSVDYENTFLIAMTSGSVGKPKGVLHSFNNLAKSALAFSRVFHFGPKNIFYHNLSMAYMAGILNLIFLPFLCGGRLIIGEQFNISSILRFWELPIKYSVNTFCFIPSILSLLLKVDRGKEGINYALQRGIVGCVATAPLNVRTKKFFEEKYNIPLFETYGLSELLFVSANSPGKKLEGSVGQLLDGVKVSFTEEEELLIDVPWRFSGYLNEKTEDYFYGEKYRSGDIGYLNEDRFLTINGRKKDIIIRGGVNINPEKVEKFIASNNVFEDQVILGLDDSILGEKTVCFFVLEDKTFVEDIKKNLNKEIIKKLGRDYYVDEFVPIDNLPKNINEKVDKLTLRRFMETSKN
ncbi:MAG: hypothetical protein CMD96_06865 [Gammaproteobacteria bacterium]|nr:hypothetical protein [Gammaproteobacteria bacterium]HJP17163.1 class I adenylate-forming enzyme family protein [Nitrospinota bacterium]|tara:strand:+ start:572 stop:2056 length:1485 start_codon:yes stop_codon:yes gene_type:complete